MRDDSRGTQRIVQRYRRRLSRDREDGCTGIKRVFGVTNWKAQVLAPKCAAEDGPNREFSHPNLAVVLT